jgi:creatinine amidohydrolase
VQKVEYELMRPGEVMEARQRAPVAFVPVSPLEWHGPHLPLGTDGLHAWHVSVRVARQVGGVVLPPFYAGTDTLRLPGTGPEQLGALGLEDDVRVVGMDFPDFPVKSVYFEESAFGLAVREIVRALKRDEYRLIVLANGHGATNQQQTLNRIALEETDLPRVRVIHVNAWVPPQPPALDPGHAERQEAAVLLALAGEHVALDELPATEPLPYRDYGVVDGPAFDGNPTPDFTVRPDADPRKATPEEGERILAREVERAAERVRRELESLGLDGLPKREQQV